MTRPDRWVVATLAGLAALYVVELVATNLGVDVLALAWWPVGTDRDAAWQPLTRFLVQGPNPLAPLLAGLVLAFFLPQAPRVAAPRVAVAAILAALAGGSVAALAAALLGAPGPAMGWGVVATALVTLYGLARPDGTVLLVVLPVSGRWLVWGTGALAAIYVLAQPGMQTVDHAGAWAAEVAWWTLLGPPSRRRRLESRKAAIERELAELASRRGDDLVH